MDTFERLQHIREHFDNISIEEFEQNLQRAGIEAIRPAAEFGYEMVLQEETNYQTAECGEYRVRNYYPRKGDSFSYEESMVMGLAA